MNSVLGLGSFKRQVFYNAVDCTKSWYCRTVLPWRKRNGST